MNGSPQQEAIKMNLQVQEVIFLKIKNFKNCMIPWQTKMKFNQFIPA